MVDFGILGPLEAWEQGRRLPLAGSKQRALLAWGEPRPRPPRSALTYDFYGLRDLVGRKE